MEQASSLLQKVWGGSQRAGGGKTWESQGKWHKFRNSKEKGGLCTLWEETGSGRALLGAGAVWEDSAAWWWDEERDPAHRHWGLYPTPALQPSWKAPDTQPRRGGETQRTGHHTDLV